MVCDSQPFNIFFERKPFMAIFSAYFDESGKSHSQRVVTFCGVCASASKIQSFEDDWNGLLRRYEMPYLSMKYALRITRPLSKKVKAQTIRERIDALKPFSECIRQHMDWEFHAVDVEAYEKTSFR